jgi:hypothetical protein
MEARAAEVFRMLRLLTNCVIFFDEYEEFFRARENEKPIAPNIVPFVDSRTVAAFITSGMLPRLQELHDERRCLVFLATNSLKSIDVAVRRAGRFDFRLEIQHPDQTRAIEYVKDSDTKIRREIVPRAKGNLKKVLSAVEKAITEYAQENKENAEHGIPFKNVEDALRLGALAAGDADADIEKRARRMLSRGIHLTAPEIGELV